MTSQIELQLKINAAAEAQIPSLLQESTVPIVIAHEGAVHHFGTGTLFRVANHHFLVTAGHVFKQASANGKSMGIGGASDGHFIALAGQSLVSAAGQYGTTEDPLDIALHQLPAAAVDRLSNKRFLIFDDIDFGDQSPTAVYTVFGFPAVWSSPSMSDDDAVNYKALQYTSHRYDRDTSTLQEYQERLHLLIDAQLQHTTDHEAKSVEFTDLDGEMQPFPRGLGGISGCSVWRIGDLNIPPDQWATEKSRLVAVQTGVYHAKRVIKATRWVAVSTLIHGAFPELRPAMKLWRLP